MTMCRVQEWKPSLSYFLNYSPLMVSDAISCPLHNLKTLRYIIMICNSYVDYVLIICRVEKWQLSLSYFLSYFLLIVSDASLCPLHTLKNLWYFIMILHSYVQHISMMCQVQEWQLSPTYFPSYYQLIVSDVISCLLHNLNALWYIIIILYSYDKQGLMMCPEQE